MPSNAPAPVPTAIQPLSWEFAALTDAGKVRANNEDALAFDPTLGVAVLADGMGGYRGGEVASGMAIALVRASFGRWLAHAGPSASVRATRRAMQDSTDEANRAIFEASAANEMLRGMGTTLVTAAFGASRVLVGHIGDSRCYRLRGTRLQLLTRDHSLLQEQLDAGVITPEEAAISPHRNLVTRALGIERAVEIDMSTHHAELGDLFVLCSDGLTEMVTNAQIRTLLLQDVDIAAKATLLVATANENGGRDNVSVILALAGSPASSG